MSLIRPNQQESRPRAISNSSFFFMQHAQTTPVPNVLFDIFLRQLKGAELKVLLIIIRQTLGWADAKTKLGRKERDWISGSQLQLKTGISRRAISIAIEGLVKRELIEVSDGISALNDASNRRGKVRLYFRLFPVLACQLKLLGKTSGKDCITENPSAHSAQDIRKNCAALAQKMRITKETLQN